MIENISKAQTDFVLKNASYRTSVIFNACVVSQAKAEIPTSYCKKEKTRQDKQTQDARLTRTNYFGK